MTIMTTKYRAKDGSRCEIRTIKTDARYAVVIDWPCGCQDFPDILWADHENGLESRLKVAQIMVSKLGFIEVPS